MKKTKRRQTKVVEPKFTLDHEEFYALTDLLFEVMKENNAGCARVLGISAQTWRSWETDPPSMPHWNLVIRYVIKHILSTMIASRKGTSTDHRNKMMDALARVPNSTNFMEEVHALAMDEAGSVTHLRRLLQQGGMFWDQIRLPAHNGGFSRQALRMAAARLNVIKTQEGFGSTKRSFWRLPTVYDES